MVPELITDSAISHVIGKLKLSDGYWTKYKVRRVIKDFLDVAFEDICDGNPVYINNNFRITVAIREYDNPDFKKDVYSPMFPRKLFYYKLFDRQTQKEILFYPDKQRLEQLKEAIKQDKFFKYLKTHERNYIYKRGRRNDRLN